MDSSLEYNMGNLKIETSDDPGGQMKLSAYFSKPAATSDQDIFDTINYPKESDGQNVAEINETGHGSAQDATVAANNDKPITALPDSISDTSNVSEMSSSFNTIMQNDSDASKKNSDVQVFTFFSKQSPKENKPENPLPASSEKAFNNPSYPVNSVANLLTDTDLMKGIDSNLDESFTTSVQSSHMDHRHNAWIPSERTKAALLEMSTSATGTYFPDKDLLTMPGIMLQEEMVNITI